MLTVRARRRFDEGCTISGCSDGTREGFVDAAAYSGCGVCALGSVVSPVVCSGCSCGTNCAQTMLTANDLFGCGSDGAISAECGVLDRTSNNLCAALGSPWSCGNGSGCDEAGVVTKSASAGGGVLCCMD